MEIREGNKLIAKFMGKERRYETSDNVFIDSLKYHSSWDWLMPVVEKITQYKFEEDNDNAYLRTFGMLSSDTKKPMVRFNRFGLWEAPTLIEATWLAVIEFIKHQEKKKNDCSECDGTGIIDNSFMTCLGCNGSGKYEPAPTNLKSKGE